MFPLHLHNEFGVFTMGYDDFTMSFGDFVMISSGFAMISGFFAATLSLPPSLFLGLYPAISPDHLSLPQVFLVGLSARDDPAGSAA
ncbi:hypothetical protein TIFTF001_042630 [Ficus carica]|uniref:Uncharacterized protein n=1 Tax=Ficus carica TaxID=3494 RepID=A0AA88CZ04_FICCA|nr:hypothetical protein TIFTF001_042630 [Ficus carica]